MRTLIRIDTLVAFGVVGMGLGGLSTSRARLMAELVMTSTDNGAGRGSEPLK
jgi:hypothetical protein